LGLTPWVKQKKVKTSRITFSEVSTNATTTIFRGVAEGEINCWVKVCSNLKEKKFWN
jgi:hypothetical protein